MKTNFNGVVHTAFQITGVALMAMALFIGLYIGTWVMFIGGWVDVITTIVAMLNNKAVAVSTLGWGIGKIVLAGPVGVALGYFCFLTGLAIATSQKKSK